MFIIKELWLHLSWWRSISPTSHHKTAVIAVTIYSSSDKLTEIWGGALELNVFDKSLQALNLTQMNQRVVYVDQHGNKIADSNQSNSDRSSSKNAMEGKAGSLGESLNNPKNAYLISACEACIYHMGRTFNASLSMIYLSLDN